MVSSKRTRPRGKKGKQPVASKLGFNGQVELAAVEVADPFEPGARVLVMRNVAARPIDQLHSRKSLDDAHKDAADKMMGIMERAEIGGAKAIDYSAVRVDTSRTERTVSDRVVRADKDLNAIRLALGKRKFDFLSRVIMGNVTIVQLAAEIDHTDLPMPSRKTRDFIVRMIRKCLDALIDHFGTGVGPERATIRVHRNIDVEEEIPA